ncbi:hypothetical protein SCUCBS95973_007476 [Sporothrix curviconia]|uniref:Zn(2)-C6 fungal-type domain-containing protein n=1 Tax=Sporothrix curviconia TaxID=1260050 RepID=A0ABP0CDK6_9PEZI
MSRQKVPDDKRLRTAQACDYCKRRKQKCNGAKPCSTCLKKSVTCTYSTSSGASAGTRPGSTASASSRPSTDDAYDESSSSASPPKRRHVGTSTSKPAEMQQLHHQQKQKQKQKQHANHHNHNYSGSINSMNSNASSSSPPSQPKVEMDAKARLKLGSMPSGALSSSASRQWSGHKNEVAIELEASYMQSTGHQSAPTSHDSARPSSGAAVGDHTCASSTSGPDEEAVMFHTSRMLKDQKGRLLYVGDSATLSFLHLFRTMVEKITGESSFTNDPSRGNIVENLVSLPASIHPPCMLPDRTTADVLIESFFVNTISLIAVFDRREFEAEVACCYANPLRADSRFLCLLNLTMAIGLILATPAPGTTEDNIVRSIRVQTHDQAEIFFRSAKCLANPLENIEEIDFWSVQALSLITVYMLAASRRNTAYSFHGMAVRSAIAIGLHRNEAMVKLSQHETELRCNVWKSLYVLDRFIAAALGRPTAISDNDCTDTALKDSVMPPQIPPIESSGPASTGGHGSIDDNFGFDSTVRSCRIIGLILRKMYARRRVSSRVTLDIAKECRFWQGEIGDSLRWKRAVQSAGAVAAGQPPLLSRAQSIAILHVNLVYCHGVILLTRPFFLFLIQVDRRNQAYRREFGRFFQDISKHGSIKFFKSVVNDQSTGAKSEVTSVSRISGVSGLGRLKGLSSRFSPPMRARSEKFAENCIVASYHTIAMIYQAHTEKYLTQRDPFIVHFLFTAILLILCNEFTAMYRNTEYRVYLEQAMDLMSYFSEIDPQARRLIVILHALRDVVDKFTGFVPSAAYTASSAAPTGSSGNARVFRSKFPESFIPGISDPVDTFFPQDIFGGPSGPLVHRSMAGGQGLGGYHSSRGSHTPAAEVVAAPGSALESAPLPGYTGDVRFFGQQGVHDALQSGLPNPTNASAMPVSIPDSTVLSGNTGTDQGRNPPVLPPPYAMPGAEVTPQGLAVQPQHPHDQHHAYQHHLDFNGMPGSSNFSSQDAYAAFGDDKFGGDYEGTDSMVTDGEGFDFELLWNWPSQIDQSVPIDVDGAHDATGGIDGVHMDLSSAMGSEDTAPVMGNVPQQGAEDGTVGPYGDIGQGQGAGVGGSGMGDVDMKQDAVHAQSVPMPALPPMFTPYGVMALPGGVGDTGLDMSGTTVHGMLPLNVPLYATAELG